MEKPAACLLCGSEKLSEGAVRDEDRLWACAACGVVFAWPQIAEEVYESYYAQTTDARYILKYENEARLRAERILRFLEKKILPGKVLDVGCGCGFFLKVAQLRGWKAVGIEIAGPMIELSRKFGEFQILQGDFEKVKKSLPRYPVVSAQHILEHARSPLQLLRDLRERLEPRGILALAVPNWESWMRQWAGSEWVCLREKGHLFHFSTGVLRKWLEKSGFRVVHLETPQWNSLDLLWAWRQKKKRKTSLPPGPGEPKAERQDQPPVPSLFRKAAAAAARPLAWTAERMKRGAEILILAEKI